MTEVKTTRNQNKEVQDEPEWQIFLNGIQYAQTSTIHVNKDGLLKDIVKIVYKKFKVCSHRYRMLFNGKQWDDLQIKLTDMKLQNESTIYIMYRMQPRCEMCEDCGKCKKFENMIQS